MKNAAGIVLWLAGHIINFLVLIAAIVYAFGTVIWMHVPAPQVIATILLIGFVPLLLAWPMRALGRRLRRKTPAARLTPAKKRLLAGVAVVVVVAFLALAGKGYAEYQCETDASRYTPASQAEARNSGFTRVCGSALWTYDISFHSLAAATRELAFTPVDLTHTPFATLESLGGSMERVTDIPSRLYRGFRMPDGHRLTLSEEDMSADGVRTYRKPSDEPDRVNGLPARLSVMEVAPDRAVSIISWVEGRRNYQLWIDANVVREPLRAQLFALAASLPKSVPACPNEPPDTEPDWPDFAKGNANASVPRVLTQAEMDAMVKPRTRPCK